VTARITTIRFVSTSSLLELAETIGLLGVRHSPENWEWVMGLLDGVAVNIARTHTLATGETERAIFRLDRAAFSKESLDTICSRIRPHTTGPIRCEADP
jgi:hypothetical protein